MKERIEYIDNLLKKQEEDSGKTRTLWTENWAKQKITKAISNGG